MQAAVTHTIGELVIFKSYTAYNITKDYKVLQNEIEKELPHIEMSFKLFNFRLKTLSKKY